MLFFQDSLFAAQFYKSIDHNKSSEIEIFEIEKLHVNKLCFEHYQDCLTFLKEKVNSKAVTFPKSPPVGHPASQFCQSANGRSEIFHDQKYNQYDFCAFDEKYIIDSWNFYNRFKK